MVVSATVGNVGRKLKEGKDSDRSAASNSRSPLSLAREGHQDNRLLFVEEPS